MFESQELLSRITLLEVQVAGLQKVGKVRAEVIQEILKALKALNESMGSLRG